MQFEFDRKKLLTAAAKGGISGASGNIHGLLAEADPKEIEATLSGLTGR